MGSAVEDYLAARAAFLAAEDALRRLSDTLTRAASALRNTPERFAFSNAPAALPPEAIMARDALSMDARTWLTGAQINEMLASFHDKRAAVRATWAAVDGDLRSGLQPPPASALSPRR